MSRVGVQLKVSRVPIVSLERRAMRGGGGVGGGGGGVPTAY